MRTVAGMGGLQSAGEAKTQEREQAASPAGQGVAGGGYFVPSRYKNLSGKANSVPGGGVVGPGGQERPRPVVSASRARRVVGPYTPDGSPSMDLYDW
ncbi:hypothetical protein GA0115254_110579 [Streptomyces sp. Ncost-T10-10d]|nr:hypothetical protein GA0115254_110579 [Streptomyces sp. Ncost-T10-10d]